MATIPPFVAKGTRIGQKQTVKAKKMVWIPVGSGEVTQFSDYEVTIAGQISILGYSGNMNIYLRLLDEDPAATTGPCILRLNKHEDNEAVYRVNKSAITVQATLGSYKQAIGIAPCNGGTQTECKLTGRVNETVHLEPTR
ncbi:MAG TPA: hypothetical protein PLD25_25865 [Chloroflexota bacterium]|nr:hypothetical protein [Chloroflexota bacterium]HUM68975.1 hypothetical protein [Chloroflexota bacterium]